MVDLVKQDMTYLWAASGDIVAPDTLKINAGWAVETVPRQWWNWMQNRVDSNVAYMLQKGIPEWDTSTEYIANKSYVQYLNVLYKCILTNTNQPPLTSPTYWVKAVVESSAAMEALKPLVPAANQLPYFDSTSTATLTAITAFTRSLLDDVDAVTARTTLGAQAADATLTALAGVATGANKLPYFTGTDVATVTDLTAFGRSLIDDADATAARTTLGVYSSAEVDADLATKQPLDATLTALAGSASVANTFPYFTGVDTVAVTPVTAFARTILDDADALSVRTTISAQPLDATLTALAGVTTATDTMQYFTGVDVAASTPLTAFGRSLLDDADAVAGRTTLGVYSTTQVDSAIAGRQPLDATLTALAGAVSAANKLPYFTGVDTVAVTDISAFGRTLIASADAAAAQATLTLANSASIAATPLNTASTIVQRDGSGNFSAGTITADLAGNASTANTLATSRTIALSGEVTGTATSFNGGANISIATSITDSGLLTPTLVNGFSHGGTPLRYRKVGNIVHVEGQVNRATAPLGVTCTTLPAGYRPSRTVSAIVELYGSTNAQRVVYSLALGSTGELNFIWPSAEATNSTQPTGTLTFSINFMFVV